MKFYHKLLSDYNTLENTGLIFAVRKFSIPSDKKYSRDSNILVRIKEFST